MWNCTNNKVTITKKSAEWAPCFVVCNHIRYRFAVLHSSSHTDNDCPVVAVGRMCREERSKYYWVIYHTADDCRACVRVKWISVVCRWLINDFLLRDEMSTKKLTLYDIAVVCGVRRRAGFLRFRRNHAWAASSEPTLCGIKTHQKIFVTSSTIGQ